MNNPTPLVPQGTIDPKHKSRARFKIGVFFVLAVHGAGLLALLLQGCHREDPSALANQDTNAAPAFETTTMPSVNDPGVAPSTNVAPAQPDPVAPSQPLPVTEYTVVSGDKMSLIAKKFNVSLAALRDANPGVEPTKLQVGKALHIPAPTLKPVISEAKAISPTPEATHAQVHTVKSGDTLSKIATAHQTTVKAIRAANNLKTDRITVGQKLRIPAKGSPGPTTETASASLTPTPVPVSQ
jgi:LysM repeat protein